MRDSDLADSPLASHRDLPSDHVDTLQDFVREAVAGFAGPLPTTHQEFRLTVAALVQAGLDDAEAEGAEIGASEAATSSVAVIRGLQVLADFPDWSIAGPAICYLRLLGHEGKSFEDIGRKFGRCRAAVQILFRAMQKRWPKFHSRGDKSDASREDCKRRRVGARKERIDEVARVWSLPKFPAV